MNEAEALHFVTVRSGSELTDADRPACAAILDDGGAVNVRTATAELPRARVVATVRRDNTIVGVGATKRERSDYPRKKRS